MSLYVLDTDTLTLWLRGHARVCERIAALDLGRAMRKHCDDRTDSQRLVHPGSFPLAVASAAFSRSGDYAPEDTVGSDERARRPA